MPTILKETHICSGHGCFPPRPTASYSPTFHVEGSAVVRKTDSMTSHCCGPPCHGGSHVGDSSYHVEGLAIQYDGMPIDCGSSSVTNVGTFNVE
jgi:uncharacterized Zn-binding protein involved in type VI secretion